LLSKLRPNLTYANVVSTVCLFIVLGGSAYAAVTITGKNVKNGSLTGADIKNSSLTTSDVKNRSLLARDFKTGQLPAGPKGDQGPKGDKGDRGDPGPFPGTLPSGTTLRGAYYAFGQATGTFQVAADAQSFGFTLGSKPTVHFIPSGPGSPPSQCPGSGNAPEAMPGHLCVYETALNNRFSVTIRDLEASPSATASSEEGFGIEATSSATGGFFSRGVWAVTAP